MKTLLLSIILFVILNSDGTCQIVGDTSKINLSHDLRFQLKKIDQYVHKIDSIKLLMISGIHGELASDGNIENREYSIDSLNKNIVKRIAKRINLQHPTTSVSYYKDNQEVFSKTVTDEFSTKPMHKEIYYENGKIIYVRN